MKLFGKRPSLAHSRIGHVLAVYPRKGHSTAFTDEVARLADEPGHTIVAVDLEPDTDPGEFEDLVDVLADCPGTLRLVPAWPGCASSLKTAEWLARRMQRTVIGHEGRPYQTADGALFIPPHEGVGWMSFAADGTGTAHSHRFPTPDWECDALSRPAAIGSHTVEPVAAGVWIHSTADASVVDMYRRRLQEHLAPDPRFPRIVVGCPGTQTSPPSAAAELWRVLPEPERRRVRFSRFGAQRPGLEYGQALAEATGAPVIVGAGVTLAANSADVDEKRTLLPEGAMGWTPFVLDLRYVPLRTTQGRVLGPAPVDVQPPISGLEQPRPGIFEYAQGMVLEVIQSGLYLRPAAEPDRAAAVRLLPREPGAALIFDDGDPQDRERMAGLTAEVLGRLDPRLRKGIRVVSARAALAARPAPAANPATRRPPAAGLRPRPGPGPGPGPQPMPTQSRAVRAVPRDLEHPGWPEAGRAPVPRRRSPDVAPVARPEIDRTWLRQRLGAQHQIVARQLMTMLRYSDLSPDPKDPAHNDMLTDLIAARLYLTGWTEGLEEARASEPGRFDAMLARSAATALSRLPVYHGPVFAGGRPETDTWEAYGGGARFLVEPSVRRAMTQGLDTSDGLHIAMWSASARQTAELMPEKPELVVFLPGTRFEIVAVDREHRTVLLLEDLGPGRRAWPWAQADSMRSMLETAVKEQEQLGIGVLAEHAVDTGPAGGDAD